MKTLLHTIFLFSFFTLFRFNDVSAQCTADFSASPLTSCAGSAVSFTNNSSGGSLSYQWTFGDTASGSNDTSLLANPNHFFARSGSYTVKLVITDTSNCKDSIEKIIVVLARPTANFKASADSACGTTTITFTNQSTGALSYNWNFDDPASGLSNKSATNNPAHTFSSPGTYNVKLVITSVNGCKDSIIKQVKIFSKPVSDFSPVNVCAGLITKFNNNTSIGSGDSIVSWNWNFGDGSFSTDKSPFHTYSSAGTYNVKLVANSSHGCKDSITKSITVYRQPTATAGSKRICQGGSVTFSGTVPDASGATITWNFGDGLTENKLNTFHVYNLSGTFFPKLIITYPNGAQCFVQTDSVVVMPKPDVDFSINDPVQCIENNSICITDLTKVLPGGSKIIKRSILWGDGTIDNSTPLNIKTICHNYTSPSGGDYDIIMEITDSAGCVTKKEIKSGIKIVPLMSIAFSIDNPSGCFETHVELTNTSSIPLSEVKSFRWEFGDGSFDTTTWTNLLHNYKTNGQFNIKLKVTNIYGCTDSFIDQKAVTNVSFNFDIKANKDTQCFKNNSFRFTQTPVPGATFEWNFNNEDINDVSWSPIYSFRTPGLKLVSLKISVGGCDSTFQYDTVYVSGADAILSGAGNRYQCSIHDTVYFVNDTLPNLSTASSWDNILTLWDFGDPYAPQCTTDTRKGINVGVNCNYSKDTFNIKHWYTPGKEQCYYTTLTLRDTVLGCEDTARINLPLMAPNAHPDPNASPPRAGMQIVKTVQCLGPEGYKSVIANLVETLPDCGREVYWIMWDSTCARQSGNFNVNWQKNATPHNYQYWQKPCDTSGNVTIGVVIQNGADSLGNICRDTAWYHNILKFNDLDPRISMDFNPAVDRCQPVTVNFTVLDTTQRDIVSYSWFWDDGSPVEVDSLPRKKTHTYLAPGYYFPKMTIRAKDGCVGEDVKSIPIGFFKHFDPDVTSICTGDSVQFTDSIVYWTTGFRFWNNASRIAANKETMLWDFGDGGGFSTSGPAPSHKYTKEGLYTVRLAVKDSSGCRDTLVKKDLISVYAAYSGFGTAQKDLVCGQVVQFNDSSFVNDTITGKSKLLDSIISWYWTFGDGKAPTSLQNPLHYYTSNGDFTVKLAVVNSQGCTDTFAKTIHIPGPQPKFEIITDSAGCAPFTIKLKNLSKDVSRYVWYLKDQNNTVISTTSDTDITFTYTQSGTFSVYLYGEDSVADPVTGNRKLCTAVYPDTSVNSPIDIIVFEKPQANFSYSTDCNNSTTSFYESNPLTSGTITNRIWDFGDGDSSNIQNPTHKFADTGTYTVTLILESGAGCGDTITKNVKITPQPDARFTAINSCIYDSVYFIDSSTSQLSTIISWDWDFGDNVTSSLQNPVHKYLFPGAYNARLIITTDVGCKDTMEKTINIYSQPQAAFNFSNVCNGLAVNFSNSSVFDTSAKSFLWNFGDGDTSTSENPSHIFPAAGTYNVKLTAISGTGCKDSVTHAVTIYTVPKADFSFTNICDGFGIGFSNLSVFGTSGASFLWNFGDGDTSTLSQPIHAYLTADTFDVKLLVTTGDGCKDSVTKQVIVYPNPIANFSTVNVCKGEQNKFTNTSTITYGTTTYFWDFGDGDTSTLAEPTHTFASADTFDVKLVITSNQGCKDSVTKQVIVHPLPQPGFNANNNCFGAVTEFLNISTLSSGIKSYYWDFGDGDTSTFESPVHLYLSSDTFDVKLVVTSDFGCKDSITKQLIIFPEPKAGFSASNACFGFANSFFDSSEISSGTLSYLWYFGDGQTSNLQNPTHLYAAADTYTVALKITSDKGCRDSIIKQVIVYPKPFADFTPGNACFGFDNSFTNTSSLAYGTNSYFWDFGDGDTSTAINPTHKFKLADTFAVKLVVTSNFGCKDSVTRNVIVYPKPVVDFSTTNACFGFANTFTNNSAVSSGSISYVWHFGDGDTSSLINPTHQYAASGTYNVKLVVTSGFGCKDSLTKQVIVYPKPTPDFSFTEACKGFANTFTDLSVLSSGTKTLLWYFGDGDTSTAKNPTHIYANDGIYDVKLVVTSDQGCRDSITKQVTVHPLPIPSFSGTNACFGFANSFTNSSSITSGTVTYLWQFGDGDTSTLANPVHIYKNADTFDVKLIVTSNKGCKDSVTKQVIVYPKPTPGFSATTACFGFTNTFTNSSSITYGTISYLWNFGDGNTSVLTNPTHIYAYADTFDVKLIVTSDNGCKDSVIKQVIVYPRPQVDYNFTNACLGFNNSFTNLSTVTYGTITYLWNFGDGNTSTQKDPAHQYAAAGTYDVKLVVTSDHGCKDSVTKQITVYPKPKADFAGTNACFGFANSFTNSSTVSSGTITYNWYFGDGNTSTLQNPTHIYAAAGTYDVKLVVTSGFGCKDSLTKQVIVYPKPTPDYSFTNACKGFANTFTDLSVLSSGTKTLLWYFGDGDTSTAKNPTHIYANDGVYDVKLVVTSDKGCKDSVTKQVTVHPLPVVAFDSVNACFGFQNLFINNSTITSGTITYLWDFGDGQTSTQKDPAHIYATADTYTVKLIVTSGFGCRDSLTKTVVVYPKPTSVFSATNACFGFENSFTNASTISSGTISYLWNFGDGNTSALANPTHIYAAADTYTVQLIVTSGFGCQDTMEKDVIVYPKPDVDFEATNACFGFENTFSNLSKISSGTITYLWDFGDGDTSSLLNPTHIYAIADTYTVKLLVTSSFGCQDSIQKQVISYPKPSADFDGTNACYGFANTFTNKSEISSGTLSYIWSFGDGDSSDLANPAHIYAAADTYQVTLIIISGFGCTDTITKDVIVYPKPEADFDFTEACVGYPNVFTNKSSISSGSITYKWYFGDGTSNTQEHPFRTYKDAGKYYVTLEVTSDHGCIDTITKEVNVFFRPQPDFTTSDVCFGDSTVFSNLSMIGSSDTLMYSWYFGDGDTSSLKEPKHKYLIPGTYNVKLLITSGQGCKDSITKQITVHPKLKGGFTINDSAQCLTNNLFSFTNTSSIESGSIISYTWIFGDGTSASGLFPPDKTYDTAGIYDMKLVTLSDNGCTDTFSKQITVYPLPEPIIEVHDACLGDFTLFTDHSTLASGNIVAWKWDFGDGNTSAEQNPRHKYAAAGIYNVTLTLTSDQGCTATKIFNDVAVIHQLPVAGIDYKKVFSGYSETHYIFRDRSSGNSSRLWQFSNGFNSTEKEPLVEFKDTGKYHLKFWAIDNKTGCIDELLISFFVAPDYVMYFPNAFTPNDDPLNGMFGPVGTKYLKEYSLKVFNRWGELVFESHDFNRQWDGKYRGVKVPMDVYLYQAKIKDIFNETHNYKGSIHLIK